MNNFDLNDEMRDTKSSICELENSVFDLENCIRDARYKLNRATLENGFLKERIRTLESALKVFIISSILLLVLLVTIFFGRQYNKIEADTTTEPSITVAHTSVVEKETEPKFVTLKAEVKSVKETTKTSESSVTYFDVPLSEDLQNHIFKLCDKYGVEPSIVIAMIWRESNFKAKVMGDNGDSYGLMQIQPKWHEERMRKLNCTDLLDPYQNVTVGIDIFAELLDRDKGLEWALMAYNGGASYANRKTKAGVVSDYAKDVILKSGEF